MRFVPVKSEETQGAAMVFRVRELADPAAHTGDQCLAWPPDRVRSRSCHRARPTQRKLIAIIEDPDSGMPADAIATLKVLVETALRSPRDGDRETERRDQPSGQRE
jgi:transposase